MRIDSELSGSLYECHTPFRRNPVIALYLATRPSFVDSSRWTAVYVDCIVILMDYGYIAAC